MKLCDFITLMQGIAPASIAEQWDNVGLLLGTENEEIHRVLVALSLSMGVAEEAVNKGAQLVLTHHPIFFRPVKRMLPSGETGAAYKLIRNGIGLFAAHTNLDGARLGVNDVLAGALKLKNTRPLEKVALELYKLQVYTPLTHHAAVESAVLEAGAGKLGEYSHCAFRAQGEGSFMPLSGARPSIGSVGALERVDECKLETVVQKQNIRRVIEAMLSVHPYETPAFDLFKLELHDEVQGQGRVGELDEPMAFDDFATLVKKAIGAPIKLAGGRGKTIRRVAVCGGSGMSLLPQAKAAGADVFVTAEIKLSDAIAAVDDDMALIDAGHYETERLVLAPLIERLQGGANGLQYNVEFILSETEKAVFAGI